MNLKFKERYSNAKSLINFKLSLIQDDMIPFFMVDFSPKFVGPSQYTWHTNPASTFSKNKSYSKYKYSTLMKYISTFNFSYPEAKAELDQFCSAKTFEKYYYNGATLTRTQLIDVFNNNQSHSYKDIITAFNLGTDRYGITQGLLTTLKPFNGSYKIGSPLVMLVVKKECVPIIKLQILLDKPISFEFFEIWVNDEILSFPDTTKKTLKAYLIDKFDNGIPVKWKSNMACLSQGYRVPALETLADKREWLTNKELELRNKLYGESNALKVYTISSDDQMIVDSKHPEVQPKPKKFIVELVD